MSIYQFKRQFQNLLRPVSQKLVHHGLTANQVTLGAVVLSGVTAHYIAHTKHRHTWLILPTSLFVRMAMNAIDGMMAKEHHQASTLGAWLNEAGDLISDALLLSSLFPHLPPAYHLALKRTIVLSLATECVAITSTLHTGERANHGPLGKSDRAFLLGFVGLLIGCGVRIDKYQKPILTLSQTLLCLTLYRRGQFVLHHRSLSQENSHD